MKSRRTFRGVVLRDPPQRGAPRPQSSGSLPPRAPPGGSAAGARVRIGREIAGRGGKGVSVITGLPLSEEELLAMARRLKKLCGAGGTVRDGIIEIQGDHRDLLVAELCKLGYAARRSGG